VVKEGYDFFVTEYDREFEGSGFHHCSRNVSATDSNRRVRDPYARWCGRGRWVTAARMPITEIGEAGILFSLGSFSRFFSSV